MSDVKPMRISRFLTVSLVLLLVLMPIWYFYAAHLAKIAVLGAGWVLQSGFDWVQGAQVDNTIGVLQTNLRSTVLLQDKSVSVGRLAPTLDYRQSGYGLVIFWALLLASFPTRWWQKLLVGTFAMLTLQIAALCIQWLNDVFNRASSEVALQVVPAVWAKEIVAFLFHFNLFILTPLAPVLVWVVLEQGFVKRLWSDLGLLPVEPGSVE